MSYELVKTNPVLPCECESCGKRSQQLFVLHEGYFCPDCAEGILAEDEALAQEWEERGQ